MFETMVLILKKQRLQSKLKSKMISRERGMGTWVMAGNNVTMSVSPALNIV